MMRDLFKSKYFIMSFILVFFVAFFLILNKEKTESVNVDKIDVLLGTDSYSYLNEEAKNYIKQVYENTGVVLLTEKNKEANKVYFNPAYANYLSLTEEEKNALELIPEPLISDSIGDVEKLDFATTYPATYDIRNVDGKNYVTPQKDQGDLGICWSISSIETAESYALQHIKRRSYTGADDILAPRQIDYALSNDGMVYKNSSGTNVAWTNTNNGFRDLTGGGNFYMASFAMANGDSLFNESNFRWNENKTKKLPGEVFDYSKSLYEINETFHVPSITSTTTSSQVTIINNLTKAALTAFGGGYIGAYSSQSTCGFKNTDGKYVIKVDDCEESAGDGHAMQLVGWDDNYTYSYCKSGTSNLATSSGRCSSGTLKTGKGAWLVRNSWGSNTDFLYVTYDSYNLLIAFISDMTQMANRKWDNNYHYNAWNNLEVVEDKTTEYTIKNPNGEKLEKIKILSMGVNSQFDVSIIANGKTYNAGTLETTAQGVYTVDVSSLNIVVTNSSFKVKVTGKNDYSFFIRDSISVFTSNVNKTKYLNTTYTNRSLNTNLEPFNTNPVVVTDSNVDLIFDSYTRNIPANANITYRFMNNNSDYTSNFLKGNTVYTYVLDGLVHSEFKGTTTYTNNNICGVTYTVQVLYNGNLVDSFPLKRNCNGKVSTSKVTFHSNDGLDNKEVLQVTDGTSTLVGSLSDTYKNKLFDVNKYVRAWNTQADGKGTSFTAGPVTDINFSSTYKINYDLDLYAQWTTTGHQFTIEYACASGCTGSTAKTTVRYNNQFIVRTNGFTKTNYTFLHWKYGSDIYYPDEKYTKNLITSPYNNTPVTFEAVWATTASAKEITFNSNGGVGTMNAIYVPNNTDTRLKTNMFTKTGNAFKNWNTKEDGTGTAYADGATIKTTTNLTLYAQWEPAPILVTFNSNNGTNQTSTQNYLYGIAQALNPNTYSRVGYTFKKWTTNVNGTGTSYTDLQNVTLKADTTLYAQWEPIKYYVVFEKNGGTGSMSKKTLSYDKGMTIECLFKKQGYECSSWNTKADGTGTSYSTTSDIKNLTTVAGETITLYPQWTEAMEFTVKNYKLDENKKYIDYVVDETTFAKYMTNIVSSFEYDVLLGDKQYIYTGSKTRLFRNGSVYAVYTNIVRGDINGDGKLTALDYVYIKNHIMRTKVISDSVLVLAADANKDNKISALDYVTIKNRIMNRK